MGSAAPPSAQGNVSHSEAALSGAAKDGREGPSHALAQWELYCRRGPTEEPLLLSLGRLRDPGAAGWLTAVRDRKKARLVPEGPEAAPPPPQPHQAGKGASGAFC